MSFLLTELKFILQFECKISEMEDVKLIMMMCYIQWQVLWMMNNSDGDDTGGGGDDGGDNDDTL